MLGKRPFTPGLSPCKETTKLFFAKSTIFLFRTLNFFNTKKEARSYYLFSFSVACTRDSTTMSSTVVVAAISPAETRTCDTLTSTIPGQGGHPGIGLVASLDNNLALMTGSPKRGHPGLGSITGPPQQPPVTSVGSFGIQTIGQLRAPSSRPPPGGANR